MELVLGIVTEREREEIKKIFEKKGALEDLFSSLGRNNSELTGESTNVLYDKIVEDMKSVRGELLNWWEKTAVLYGWEYESEDKWNVNMSTGEVKLIKQ